jgi:hypothetical protein
MYVEMAPRKISAKKLRELRGIKWVWDASKIQFASKCKCDEYAGD